MKSMSYEVPYELRRYAEVIYGKLYVKRCLEKDIVKTLYQGDIEDALTEHFNLNEKGQTDMSSKTLHVLSIVGNMKFNDKVTPQTMWLITNPYFRQWVYGGCKKSWLDVFPHSNIDLTEVELAYDVLNRDEAHMANKIRDRNFNFHRVLNDKSIPLKEKSEQLQNFIKALNVKVDNTKE